MKAITLPGFNSTGRKEVNVGLLWDHRSNRWLAVINDPTWRCEVASDSEQERAVRKATNRLFAVVDGYDPESYPHHEVWVAYCAAREMPASPIYSIPV
ncbi:MAG: hypothetical protein BWY19_00705 [bacterium ADurb.Bin212]|nr:MAG: hypothetical protein BWY19_00705 [bacterium ADurb.Bin212]